jgi:hypothetical protein
MNEPRLSSNAQEGHSKYSTPTSYNKCITDPNPALHQRSIQHKLFLPTPMLLGSRRSHVSIFAHQRGSRIDRLRQYLRWHRHDSHRGVTRRNGVHGSQCRRAVSLDSDICAAVQQVLWANARLDHDVCVDMFVYIERGTYCEYCC